MSTKTAAICMFLLTVLPAAMRAQSGIAGTVKDASGAVLPGVIVVASSPALIEKSRTVLTDGRGEFKLIDLRPGTYSVKFTAEGFTPQQRDGVELTTNFVADINASLQVGSSTQAVDVSADISGLDVQSSTQQSVLTRSVMDDIPTGHNIFADAQVLPGATLARPDVGGSSGMQQTSIQVHGAPTADCVFEMDGMNVSQLGSCAVGVYYNDGVVQETSYQTSAIPAETSAGGLVMNMVVKTGGNQFHGSFYGSGGSSATESNNVSAKDISTGILAAGNHFESIYDLNGNFGGPIKKDKLWFFSSVRRWSVNEYVANTFTAPGVQALDDNRITEAMLRLDYQVTPKNKFSIFYDKDMKLRGHRRDTSSQFSYLQGDSAVIQKTPLGYISQAHWTSVVSPKWVIEGGVSFFFLDYTYAYEDGVTNQSIPTVDIALSTLNNAAAYIFRSIGARRTYQGSASYVSGSHNLKFGIVDSTGAARMDYTINGDTYAGFSNGVPLTAYQYNTPVDNKQTLNTDLGIYAQDSWTLGRLTVNAGVRFEMLVASEPAQSSGAGTWVGARTLAPVSDLPNWKTIVPRIGLAYKLTSSGNTVLRASASKYEGQVNDQIAQAVDPLTLQSQTCTWNAPAGTTPALMATQGQTILNASTFTNCTGFAGGANTHVAANIKRPYSWEYTALVQREVLPQLIVSAGYFLRQNRNVIGTANTAAPISDYTPFVINNPLTGAPLTVYNLAPADKGKQFLAYNNYSQLNTDYNGMELIAKKNWSTKGAFLQTSLAIGRLYGRTAVSDLNNPNLLYNSLGDVQMDSTYQFRINGSYPLPWAKIKISGNFQHLTGTPFNPSYTVNTKIDPGLTQVTQALILAQPGSERLPSLSLLDLRASRVFTFRERWKVEPLLDLYNVLNVNTPYTEVTAVGANLGHYSANTEGRILKVGLQVNF